MVIKGNLGNFYSRVMNFKLKICANSMYESWYTDLPKYGRSYFSPIYNTFKIAELVGIDLFIFIYFSI